MSLVVAMICPLSNKGVVANFSPIGGLEYICYTAPQVAQAEAGLAALRQEPPQGSTTKVQSGSLL